ncbi:hypothetical protein RUM43_007816 [Polyplax serrata]|uniref:Uncharacterized protein n=1 Tax=Polyplax serrata TaxID=468196 RepID=A0AAN8S1Z9_POLSC
MNFPDDYRNGREAATAEKSVNRKPLIKFEEPPQFHFLRAEASPQNESRNIRLNSRPQRKSFGVRQKVKCYKTNDKYKEQKNNLWRNHGNGRKKRHSDRKKCQTSSCLWYSEAFNAPRRGKEHNVERHLQTGLFLGSRLPSGKEIHYSLGSEKRKLTLGSSRVRVTSFGQVSLDRSKQIRALSRVAKQGYRYQIMIRKQTEFARFLRLFSNISAVDVVARQPWKHSRCFS